MNKILKSVMVAWLVAVPLVLTAQGEQPANNEEDASKKLADEAEAKWHNPDYRPYISAFDDLIKLSDAFAENKLRLALSNYQTGRSLVQKMREDVQRFREEAAEAKHLNEKWYWQTIDRRAREERIVQMKKDKAKMRAVTYFTRAIHHLDEIGNRKVRESDKFKNLQADVYRDWVIQQYDLQNIPQIIDITERYVKLDPRFETEVSPHKFLASAYGFKEAVANKYSSGTEDERLFYKKKKNEHLLRATELKYKKDSPEYEQILEIVNRDEIVAIAP